MNIQSETIQYAFYSGFVETLKFSTSAGPDYSEPPCGYTIRREFPGDWCVYGGESNVMHGGYESEWDANRGAWENSGEEPPELESMEDFGLSDDTDVILRAVCRTFCRLHSVLLHNYAREMDRKTDGCATVWEHAGHDFWLTLAGHGTGYWDRGLGKLGDDLTAACEPFREKIDPYIGDDGLIHV